jgi:3-hydroxyisobutyrate dehydrogenase-like beta-hydroxyacid dehydrogenase
MGTPMALRLLAAGHELSVWKRREERTKPLLHQGAIAAATPAEAELGADAVVSMLRDDSAYEEVLFGVHRLIDAFSPGGLHILCGTITVDFCRRVTREHAEREIDLVAAPVIGNAIDAAEGRLWTIAAGTEKAVESARQVLEAFSREIVVAGDEPWMAYRLRLERGLARES